MSSGKFEPSLPSVAALKLSLNALGASVSQEREKRYIRKFNLRSIESEESYARLTGLQDHFKHKGHWSWFLMALMLGMIGFQCFLLAMVGLGRWDFRAYDWLLPALLGQNLAQIVGLAVFVVRSLFSDPKISVSAASNQPIGDSDETP